MICVNELSSLKCNKRAILEQLIVLLAPFAPHTAEELWHTCGHNTTVCDAEWPVYNEEYLKENSLTYAISSTAKLVSAWNFQPICLAKRLRKPLLPMKIRLSGWKARLRKRLSLFQERL